MSKPPKNFIGKRFGKLLIIEKNGYNKRKEVLWKCRCDCGNETIVKTYSLTRKRTPTRSCGCIFHPNLIGKKFGKLTVIKEIGHKNTTDIYWLCRCDCGNEKEVITENLNCGHVKSCGCMQYKWKKYDDSTITAKNSLYSLYKYSAEKKSRDFILTIKEFINLIQQNCYYCGIKPLQIKKLRDGIYKYNGIDRIDNTKGYTIDNAVTCCKRCNYIKSNLTINELYNHINNMYNNLKLKKAFKNDKNGYSFGKRMLL